MYLRFATRDLTIASASLGLWHLMAGHSAGAGFVSDLAGVTAGLALGVSAYLAHEWGHLLAAVASGSVVTPGTSLRSGFVFSFDAKRNGLPQFLVMSLGGFIATGLVLWAVYALLPDHLLASRVARGAVAFLALLGVTLELPLVLWGLVVRGVPAPVDVSHGRGGT